MILCILEATQGGQRFFKVRVMPYGHRVGPKAGDARHKGLLKIAKRGFRLQGLRLRFQGFKVLGFRSLVQVFRDQVLGFRSYGSGLQVRSLRFR